MNTVDDLAGLAALSHALAEAAITGVASGAALGDVADEVVASSGGRREVAALALSYVLRAEVERGLDLAEAVDAVSRAVRRLASV